MILVYSGPGKGKTSACLGQALRALGHGYRVAFGQYIKRDGQAGEQRMLSNLLGDDFCANGLGFVKNCSDRAPHEKAARFLLSWAMGKAHEVWILILDEALYALEYGLLTKEDFCELMAFCQKQGCHLVLSGRVAPPWLIMMADMVSTIDSVKHPFSLGASAQKGLEY
ncbi:MAG: cob(I)yrinic acid a,c-diamide adenosyltransferase [Desulfovibrio sp.]|nr:cob(I)yrinic acid a,c-diamide adenosyltransferase [Desulfovibrio sp.]